MRYQFLFFASSDFCKEIRWVRTLSTRAVQVIKIKLWTKTPDKKELEKVEIDLKHRDFDLWLTVFRKSLKND